MPDVSVSGVHEADVAIIGLAGRFPGAADVAAFWRNISQGVESISFFTDDALRALGVDAALVQHPKYVKAGAVLDRVEWFDAEFFEMKPSEALITDPQHRVFLECAWEALEDAGYSAGRVRGSVGVYAGSNASSYLTRFRANPTLVGLFGEFLALLGNDKDYLTTRVSYKLDLTGPSVAVQSACSTSLVAVHLACQSILNGECDLALAGGVGISALQPTGYLYDEGGIHSPDGHCRPFDAKAQGTVSGAGVGVVVLKSLARAVADGDAIRAVIKGSAINNDGHVKMSYVAPSVEGQARAISEALTAAGVDPGTVRYVEAHGTGTPLGDPVEVAALTQAFRTSTAKKAYCAVGSVKANIGHLTAAAGVAGLIKAVSALEHGVIPPSPYFEHPNPRIDWQSSPFFVNNAPLAWTASESPRRALVSSLGIGGTNAHVILEEAPAPRASGPPRAVQVLTLSAKTTEALDAMTNNLASHLRGNPTLNLADVAYTLQVGRAAFAARRVVVSCATADAMLALDTRDALAGGTRVIPRDTPSIAFLFPGGGAQFVRMGADLYAAEPAYRDEVDRCLHVLGSSAGTSLRQILFPTDPVQAQRAERAMARASVAHPALFIIEYSLATFLSTIGVRPTMLIGHSMGEYAAACVAGVFSLEAALELVVARGTLMERLPAGTMLVVPLAERDIMPLLGDQLSLAAVNAPTSCVVSGPTSHVDALEAQLQARAIDCRRLRFSHASHSAMMEPMIDDFTEAVRRASPREPSIPLISNLTGTWMSPAEAVDPHYWARHLRHTVRFSEGLREVVSDPERLLIEVGPGRSLAKLVRRQSPACANRTVVACLQSPDEETSSAELVARAMGECWLRGVAVDWDVYHAGAQRRRVPLPTYPFERRRFWIEDVEPADTMSATAVPVAALAAPASLMEATRRGHEDPPTNKEPTTMDGEHGVGREAALTTLVAGLFGFSVQDISPTATFLELGADSLLLLRASRAVEDQFGVTIPFRLFMTELSSVRALGRHLDAQLPPEAQTNPTHSSGVAETRGSAPTSSDGPDMSSDREGMTPPPTLVEPATALERVMTQQLQIMATQLGLLGASGAARDRPASTPRPQEPRAMDAAPGDTVTAAAFGPFRPVRLEAMPGMTPVQSAHLGELIADYTRRTSESKRRAAGDRDALADPRAAAGFQLAWKEMIYPIVGERSKGARLWDVDGNEYVDFTMGFGVHLFGHSPDFLVDAISRQLSKGIHIGPQSELAGRAARMVAAATGMERVAFCNSGTEAIMGALRLARAATKRTKVVMFAGSYHGTFDGVLARPRAGAQAGSAVSVAPGTPPGMIADVVVLEYGDPEALTIIRQQASTIAAVLVEPVQSRNLELQPAEFLAELRDVTTRQGIALIFDEIITGFRIHPAGAQGWFGVKADLAAYGKVLAGGLPIGVVAGRAEYLDAIDGGRWAYGDTSCPSVPQIVFAGTFSKNPFAMAATEATLTVLDQQGPALQQEMNDRTTRLVRAVARMFDEERVPIKISHFASLFRFTREPSARWLDLLFYHVVKQGIYIWEGRGCFLSAAHTDADVDRFVDAMTAGVHELQQGGFIPTGSGHVIPAPRLPASVAVASHDDADEPERDLVSAGPAWSTDYELVPTTAAMRQLWVHTRFSRSAALAYHERLALHMRGPLDAEALNEALGRMIVRHEALRATYDRSGAFMRIASRASAEIDWRDARDSYARDGETAIGAVLDQESQEVLEPERGALFRVRVYALADAHALFVLVFHHGVMDGYSADVFVDELSAFYTSAVERKAYHPPPTMRLRDYMLGRVREETSASMADAEAYWLKELAGAATFSPAADSGASTGREAVGGRERLTIGLPVSQAIKRVAAASECTTFTALLAAFCTLMHRWSGEDDLTIGIPHLGRTFRGDERTLAHCVDLQPLRSRTSSEQMFAAHLSSINARLLEAGQYGRFTYANLARARRARGIPAIATTFNLDPDAGRLSSGPRFGNLEVVGVAHPVRHVKFDLHWNIAEGTDGLHVSCDYNAARFDAAKIRSLLEAYAVLLEEIGRDPHRRCAAFPLLTAAARLELERALPVTSEVEDVCVHELFAGQAARVPQRHAVVHAGETLTYQDLDARTNRCARWLRARGIGPETRVALCVERGIDMIVGMLGIMKAGAAYVPLDPMQPEERLRFMLEDSGACAVLTEERVAPRLPTIGLPVIRLDADWTRIEAEPDDVIDAKALPGNAAYVIYTSGSSGRPKGVCVTHAGLAHLIAWHRAAYGLTETDRTSQFANPSFDACAWEVWPTLASGAALYIAEPRIVATAPAIPGWLDHHDITISFLPTPLAEAALAESWPATVGLRYLLTGGDRLHAVPDMPRSFAVVNHYGPTEVTVVSTCHTVRQGQEAPPIGRPIDRLQAYVLERGGELAPPGIAGELYVGGSGMARGYAGQPGMTAERFLPDGFSGRSGSRIYRTGDVVRWRDDGELDYLGRADDQVKIRGFRVEVGEIEAALGTCDAVTERAVVVRRNAAGDPHLVAFVAIGEAGAFSAIDLRAQLRLKVPEYMIPSAFVVLDRLPLTPNGKIDRKALIAMEVSAAGPAEGHVSPRTPTEETVAGIWTRVLGIEAPGVCDNFFDHGGDSLSATRIISQIRAAMHVDLDVATTFDHATIAELSMVIDAQRAASMHEESPRDSQPLLQ